MGYSFKNSAQAWEKAAEILVGGVNSPVRAFNAVGGDPVFFNSGSGCRFEDVDGNSYIDYVLSWGPLILGHAYPPVVQAATEAIQRGSSFGAPTEAETELAELIRSAYPSMEKVRLVNSGTEATMSALRLARGVTGRDGIVKFAGCYHGHADGLLAAAGSGATTLGVPTSPGVPAAAAAETRVLPFNDIDALQQLFDTEGEKLAAIILEPIPGNMGVILPDPNFLDACRQLTRQHGALLIFDEVMCGFRCAWGGAQEVYKITPDITCLGKVVGGGFPLAAYGASKEIMSHLAPEGPVYQAGTLSGNPVAVAAGIATLTELEDTRDTIYPQMDVMCHRLVDGILAHAELNGIPMSGARIGTMWCLFFNEHAPRNYAEAQAGDTERFGRYFRGMLERGHYLAPSAFEAGFLSIHHSEDVIDSTIEAAGEVLTNLS
jgi:glutamate-1-semialdehyde 2,1-aminomutase